MGCLSPPNITGGVRKPSPNARPIHSATGAVPQGVHRPRWFSHHNAWERKLASKLVISGHGSMRGPHQIPKLVQFTPGWLRILRGNKQQLGLSHTWDLGVQLRWKKLGMSIIKHGISSLSWEMGPLPLGHEYSHQGYGEWLYPLEQWKKTYQQTWVINYFLIGMILWFADMAGTSFQNTISRSWSGIDMDLDMIRSSSSVPI